MTAEQQLRAPPSSGLESAPFRVEDPTLWVELEITVESQDSCPIAGLSGTRVDGDVQIVGSRCHVMLAFDDEDPAEVSVYTSNVEGCTCDRVCVPGFIPVDVTVDDGQLVVSGYVANRKRLNAITDALAESDDRWRLRRLTTLERSQDFGENLSPGILADLALTEKQRRTVRTAVEMGYYRTPREASLGDLAAELGVSRSALSQRLNAVESKLIESLAAEL